RPGQTILVQAGGSGIGTVAIKMARAIGCTVITTVGDDEKVEKAKALGADHVINYRTQRFATITRKLTGKKGVDVVFGDVGVDQWNGPRLGLTRAVAVFDLVGVDTWNGSLLCLKRGGRLVTCGSTSGVSVEMNLMQLFQQQFRIIGSFGAPMFGIRRVVAQNGDG